MSQDGTWSPTEMNVAVDVFDLSDVSADSDHCKITALFNEINSAEPVQAIDMPGEVYICVLFVLLYQFRMLTPSWQTIPFNYYFIPL